MDKELEAIKTAVENYRHDTGALHQKNAEKALDIARQMLDWFDEQYRPYKEVIGVCYVNIWLDGDHYKVVYDKSAYITGIGCDIHKGAYALTDNELDVIKEFVTKWQYVKSEVIEALTFQNDEHLKKEQRLRDKEREAQKIFDGFEV